MTGLSGGCWMGEPLMINMKEEEWMEVLKRGGLTSPKMIPKG